MNLILVLNLFLRNILSSTLLNLYDFIGFLLFPWDILSLVENSNEDRKILLSLPVGADQNEKSKLVTLILLREKMAKQTLEVIKECLKIIRIADTEAAKYLCTLHVPTHILPEDENVEVNMSK